MSSKQVNGLMKGAAILSATTLIVKILSAVYRIPFQNMVGDVGFYVFQQVYPIYGLAVTLALSGLPIFISRVVAEQSSSEAQIGTIKRLFRILLMGSIIIFGTLEIGAPGMANAMGDERLAPIIRITSWLFLLVPFLATSRGYYQGRLEMRPTANSQLVEQVVRVSLILIGAYVATSQNWSVYKMGSVVMLSAPLAGLAAALLLWKKFWPVMLNRTSPEIGIPTRQLLKRLLTEGIVLTLIAAMLVLFQLVDSFTIIRALQSHGLNREAAKSVKGIYDRAQPLVQLGMVFSVALSTALLPGLVSAIKGKRMVEFQRLSHLFQKLSFALSTTITVVMIAVLPEMNRFLFSDSKLNVTISFYLLNIWLASMILMRNSLLQSLNKNRITTISLIVGITVKLLLNSVAVGYFGILGASLVTNLGLVVVLFLMSRDLVARFFNFSASGIRFLGKLLVSNLGMLVMIFLVKMVAHHLCGDVSFSRLQALGVLVLGVGLGSVTFGLVIYKSRLLTLKELMSIPYVSNWIKKRRN